MDRQKVTDVADVVDGMAEAIKGRMDDLGLTPGLFIDLTGLTGPGLANVRKGHRRAYEPATIRGVAVALRWPLNWYERVQAGEDWRAFPTEEHRPAPRSNADRINALEDEMADVRRTIAALTDRVQRLVPPDQP